ncbi:hypothetical protein GCM10010240_51890 [Streptomyces griseoviridis]|nr:hypothetical protein GCM10010240_51890 [Streptomyces griseoviridis]
MGTQADMFFPSPPGLRGRVAWGARTGRGRSRPWVTAYSGGMLQRAVMLALSKWIVMQSKGQE